MEIYSPKNGDVTKFKLNVLNSDSEQHEEPIREVKIQFKQQPKKKRENILTKAANSCVEIVKRFIEYEEVV